MGDQITKNIIVKADIDTIFRIWSNFEQFPRFMKHIKSVTQMGDRLSHWVMEGPLGKKVEWNAETTLFEPNARIGWNSKEHEGMTTSGQVVFKQLSKGETDVTVTMRYDPPGGVAGEIVAELFSHPDKVLEEDLRNFKAYAEGMYNRIQA